MLLRIRMFESLLDDLLGVILDWLAEYVVRISHTIFWAEATMNTGDWGNTFDLDPVFALFRNVGLAFITLKFVKKGFDIYVGWTDGDKDNEAGHLVMNYVRAIVVLLAFNEIYRFITNVTYTLLVEMLQTLGSTNELNFQRLATFVAGQGIINKALFTVLLVIFLILYFRTLLMGLQLLALRIAFPIACVGLVDSDKGIFKSFMQKFVMISVSAFTMIFFFYLAILLKINANPFWAIASAMAGWRTPDLLRDFMLGYGTHHGGLGRFIHTSSSVARTVGASHAGRALLSRIGFRLPVR